MTTHDEKLKKLNRIVAWLWIGCIAINSGAFILNFALGNVFAAVNNLVMLGLCSGYWVLRGKIRP